MNGETLMNIKSKIEASLRDEGAGGTFSPRYQSGSKLRALQTLRAALEPETSRQRMECAQLAAALVLHAPPEAPEAFSNARDPRC